MRGAKSSTRSPASMPPLDVFDPVAKRECELLRCGRARLANVVAAHRNRVPLRHLLCAEGKHVGDEPHRGTRRIDVLLLRDEFLEDVVLNGARQRLPADTLLLRHNEVHGEQHRGRRVDRHRGDCAEVDSVEQRLHVCQRRHVDAALADLAERELVIRIRPIKRGKVESNAQSRPTGGQELLVARVGLLRRYRIRQTAASSIACRGNRRSECLAYTEMRRDRRGRARSQATRCRQACRRWRWDVRKP